MPQEPKKPKSGEQTDPNKRGMSSIEAVISHWMKKNRVRRYVDRNAVFSRWKEVVGAEFADSTRPVALRSGELVVEVDSAPLLNELSTYYREEILESLRQDEDFSEIQSIRFRAGSSPEPRSS